jgi:hypothetical protein
LALIFLDFAKGIKGEVSGLSEVMFKEKLQELATELAEMDRKLSLRGLERHFDSPDGHNTATPQKMESRKEPRGEQQLPIGRSGFPA